MDPITHTLFGAVAAHGLLHPRLGRAALLLGAAGGALPDVDVFWGFLADPALPWEHHRHFTHALAFIPIGGLIAAAPFLLFKRFRKTTGWAVLASTVGIATHGACDTFTSFGTYLYWPFINQRVAWDVMSIIDPLFTGPLILGLLLALILAKAWPTRLALLLAMTYLGLGFVQQHRAMNVQHQLADARGHERVRGRAMPSFGNLVIWRSIYEDADGMLHADAIRPGLLGATRVHVGESAQRITAADLPKQEAAAPRIAQVFAGFEAFADGYVARLPMTSFALGDVRYSMDTRSFAPMWGLAIDTENPVEPVRWTGFSRGDDLDGSGGRRDAISALWQDIRSPGPQWVDLSTVLREARN